jgi:hypothetical protein
MPAMATAPPHEMLLLLGVVPAIIIFYCVALIGVAALRKATPTFM